MAGKKTKVGYDGKIAGLYDLEDTIGRGHFAVVKLARHVFTGERVAVKVIDKTKLDEISRSHLFQEVRCMKLVQHPNVVRLYQVIDTQTKLYLILELGDGGDMYDYIMKHDGGLEEKQAKRYFRQIVEAISYCHKLHVVHRDLKPENVVFFEKLEIVKLTDFGFSNMFNPGKKLETSCGSLAYSAPEILLGDSYDPPAVDVWSLGVILYMLVVGSPPFQEANDSETLTMIMDCKYRIPDHISRECKDLISRMLVREPSQRATLEDIMAHAWLQDGDAPPVSNLPLISRELIMEADHVYVVEKMVEGNIASREEILKSLEKNSYDHLTATYFLLMEKRLRRHQQMESEVKAAAMNQLKKQTSTPSGQPSKPHLEPLSLSPRVKQRLLSRLDTPSSPCLEAMEARFSGVQVQGTPGKDSVKSIFVQSLVSPPGAHPSPSSSPKHTSSPGGEKRFTLRKCSLIREESCDMDDDGEDMEVEQDVLNPIHVLESTDDLLRNNTSHSCYGGGSPHHDLACGSNSSNNSSGGFSAGNPRRPLKSVSSSPQLLNQIFEENESDDEVEDFVPQKLLSPGSAGRPPSMASPEILRKFEARKKRRGAGQRGTSCSSSDASDTDDTEGRSRKDKLKHKFVHRRDSSDHSSDTDGPGGHGGGLGGGPHWGDGGGGSSRGDRNGGGGGKDGDGDSGRRDGNGGSRGSSKQQPSSAHHRHNGTGGRSRPHYSHQNRLPLGCGGVNLDVLGRKLSQLSAAAASATSTCTHQSFSSTDVATATSSSSSLGAKMLLQWGAGVAHCGGWHGLPSSVQYLGSSDVESVSEGCHASVELSEMSSISGLCKSLGDGGSTSSGSRCSSDCPALGQGAHVKVPTDINSNGLTPFCKCSAAEHLVKVESKCCSVV